MKRIISYFLSSVFMLTAMLTIGTSTVNAASFPSINSTKTVEFIANQSINVYTNSNLRTRGTSSPAKNYSAYVDTNDKCYIHSVAGNNSLLISYPTSSGYKKGYCRRTDVLYANDPIVTYTARIGVNTYKRPGGERYGSIAVNDSVYVYGDVSGYKGVIYPISGGKYKFGWLREDDLYTMLGMTNVTQSFSGKKVTLKSVENGRFLCADTNLSNSPAVCNRSSASTASSSWEVFGVSVTADKWAGFKAHNGKWLSATIDSANAPVRATANNLYAWECFRIYKRGSDYFLVSQANKKWVSVRVDQNNAPVQALVDTPQNWERFSIKAVTNSTGNQTSGGQNTTSNTFDPIWPLAKSYTVTTLYFYSSGKPHSTRYKYGIDMSAPEGENVLATEAGTVLSSEYSTSSGFGNWIRILHKNGKVSLYAHLKTRDVNAGQTVQKGQVIGTVGHTSAKYTIGNHLHFELGNSDKSGASGDPWQEYFKPKYGSKVVLTQAAKKYPYPTK